MAGIVEFPQIVQEALRDFGDLLPNEPQRRHFAEYLTGLFVAERKNVCGINREFAQTTDQSCLNRFLTEAAWDVGRLNQRRLDFLQEEPSTRYSAQGVIPIDNTLIDHCGDLIADVGCFWDHAEERPNECSISRPCQSNVRPARRGLASMGLRPQASGRLRLVQRKRKGAGLFGRRPPLVGGMRGYQR